MELANRAQFTRLLLAARSQSVRKLLRSEEHSQTFVEPSMDLAQGKELRQRAVEERAKRRGV